MSVRFLSRFAQCQVAETNMAIYHSHTYQELPLIPEEEFLEKFPEHRNDDENALMEARIEHERVEREALEQQRQELLKRKQKLLAENKKRKQELADVNEAVIKFISVSYKLLQISV